MQKATLAIHCLLLTAAWWAAAGTAQAQVTALDAQADLFRQVFPDVERGSWQAVENLPAADRQRLNDYILWPDLRATYYRARLASTDPTEIEAFIEDHGTLKPARDLRYRYALHLARNDQSADYLNIYASYYQGAGDARLDCLALAAEIDTGQTTRVAPRAIDLWLVGKSQVSECDPVFSYLYEQQLLKSSHYLERYALAIDAREFSLARWLGKKISDQHVAVATAWQKAAANPEQFSRQHLNYQTDEVTREQLVYAIERLTYRDPEIALELWRQLDRMQPFSAQQQLLTEQHIALWTARDRLPRGYELLVALPLAAQSDEVARWRARTSLRKQSWQNLLNDISLMSADEQSDESWRYWRAIAQQETGEDETSANELLALSEERSYYGFLAADELGLGYALGHADTAVDGAVLADLASRPELIRARELFRVGLDGRGRSEWDAATSYLSKAEKAQAAILANRWGWHSRAIATSARAGQYDDLSLRYPLPYLDLFSEHASKAEIPETWAYGVARSESLFMRDVRSHAGAIGLMQLMPATGKQVAGEIQLSYRGLPTLTDPNSNIRLGTTYLSKMAARFDGNRVLATAAYNAGPHRVDRWLPESGSIDARIWVENIPFNETREYVRRVLGAQTIFHWRVNGDIRRLSDELGEIQAPNQMASN